MILKLLSKENIDQQTSVCCQTEVFSVEHQNPHLPLVPPLASFCLDLGPTIDWPLLQRPWLKTFCEFTGSRSYTRRIEAVLPPQPVPTLVLQIELLRK